MNRRTSIVTDKMNHIYQGSYVGVFRVIEEFILDSSDKFSCANKYLMIRLFNRRGTTFADNGCGRLAIGREWLLYAANEVDGKASDIY